VTARRARRTLVVVAMAGAALGGVACGSDTADTASPGRAVYLQQCSACHGAGRQGVAGAPALTVARMQELGDAKIREVVEHGQGRMPAFARQVSGAELDALVAYLLDG
jgi:mono/diheme cytochrome c family protein